MIFRPWRTSYLAATDTYVCSVSITGRRDRKGEKETVAVEKSGNRDTLAFLPRVLPYALLGRFTGSYEL